MKNIIIRKIKNPHNNTYLLIRNLLSQLYPNNPPLSFRKFKQTIKGKNVYIYVVILNKKIIGTSQLIFYKKLSGEVWIIEDVIIDKNMQNTGIGTKLTKRMLKDAYSKGAEFVDVATRRKNARNFYIKIGFKNKTDKRPFWGLRYDFKK